MEALRQRRRQDFWTALALIAGSLVMLNETAGIPFFKADAAGVEAGQWYNSAALVPFVIFGLLLLLSLGLLVNAIRQGGLPAGPVGGGAIWAWLSRPEVARMTAAAVIMLAYIFALVPRVDFIVGSALVLMALIYGFNETRARATWIALILVLLPSLYALIAHYPQAEWAAPHDDDWVTLAAFLLLVPLALVETKLSQGRIGKVLRAAPLVSLIFPLLLVLAMAFGFRQNVPNRGGLLFQQIEYHYFVTLRPWLSE